MSDTPENFPVVLAVDADTADAFEGVIAGPGGVDVLRCRPSLRRFEISKVEQQS